MTGGPGTGKTASIRAIAGVAVAQGARVILVAPTGRAAIRMTEASGIRARTVHSALGWIPGEGPEHDEEDPLACDLLIVDESSMANLELLVVLLRAVGPRTNVVLVGDADQLAPVGAGKPFAELVSSGLVPTARLTHIFRQAAGSMIVQGAHAIRRGEAPDFTPGDGMSRDLFMIERANARAAREEIVELVSQRLPSHYGIDPIKDVQVFAPVYRGELGIDALNGALRDALNPDGEPVRGGRLRLGDKLMMTGRNLHELGLMNGTLLRLIDETDEAGAAARGRQRVSLPAPARGVGSARAGIRLLGSPRPGNRAPGRGDRRPPGRGRVLPAARDAVHSRHAREARNRYRRHARSGCTCSAHAGHGAASQPPRRPAIAVTKCPGWGTTYAGGNMSKRSITTIAATTAVALAGCGGSSSSGPSLSAFKSGFQAQKTTFTQLGSDLQKAITSAPSTSASAIATEFTSLATRTTAAAAALRTLRPPSKFSSQVSALATGFDSVAADMKSIATAATSNDASGAKTAAAKLVTDSATVHTDDLTLSRALGLRTSG